jgi:hypothetical protein
VSVSRCALACLLALLCSSCAASGRPVDPALTIDLARTRPPGQGPSFRPGPIHNPAVAAAAPVGSLRCSRARGYLFGAHIELFARDRGLIVPAGIGIAPPQRRRGAYVLGGRCAYPLRTVEPTGVVEVDAARAGAAPSVGELFALWGQALSPRQLAGFPAGPGESVAAFVDGRRWRGDPAAIPLRRHAQIVLELGPFVEPHPAYTFAPGL